MADLNTGDNGPPASSETQARSEHQVVQSQLSNLKIEQAEGQLQGADRKKSQQQVDSPRFGAATVGKYGQSPVQFINESKQNATTDSERVITIEELGKHRKKSSAWISLKGVVYDVTNYIKSHPGGVQLLEGCGRESQKLFDEIHSWVNARNILANCVVGKLQPPP